MLRKKKGQGLIEAFSWVGMIFFTILFYILFGLAGCDNTAEQKLFSDDLTQLRFNYDLASFLRTPVEYQGTKLTVSDAIVLAMDDENIKRTFIPFGSNAFFYMDPGALERYINNVRGQALTYTAANVMRTYSGFAPSRNSYHGYYFCAYKMDATKGNKRIVFYDARYQSMYDTLACTAEFTLSEATIPAPDGEMISVKIKAYLDSARMASPGWDIASQLIGIY